MNACGWPDEHDELVSASANSARMNDIMPENKKGRRSEDRRPEPEHEPRTENREV